MEESVEEGIRRKMWNGGIMRKECGSREEEKQI